MNEITQTTNDPNDEWFENYPYDEIVVGQTARMVRTLTVQDIQAFAAVSGDTNGVQDVFVRVLSSTAVIRASTNAADGQLTAGIATFNKDGSSTDKGLGWTKSCLSKGEKRDPSKKVLRASD